MMKTCTRCDKTKQLDFFYKNNRTKDGLTYWCRACVRADAKARKQNKNLEKPPNWKKKTVDMALYMREWRKANPTYMAQKKEEWLSRNSERRKVRDAVKYALKTGKLTRLPCMACGDSKVEAHHPDYSRPLDVVWLCSKHHKEIHTSI